MFNLLSGVSPEIRVILLFGFIGLMIMAAGAVLIVGLRRQAIEDSGRFDIPIRNKKPEKPAKVKKVKAPKIKPVKEPKPEKVKAKKPEKVKSEKSEKAQKEKSVKVEKAKKGGLFKKAAKPTGLTLLAAPVGSAVMPERATTSVSESEISPVAKPSLLAEPQEFSASEDFDILPATTPESTFGQLSSDDDDFDILPPVTGASTFGQSSSDDDFDILPAVASVPKIAQSPDEDFNIDSFDLPAAPKGTTPASGPFGAKAPTGDEEW
jgi:hypothetical protein